MNDDIRVEIAKTNDIFEQIKDEIIIKKIQEDAQKIWPRGIDDPAYV